MNPALEKKPLFRKIFLLYLALLHSQFSPLSFGHCSFFWQASEFSLNPDFILINLPNPVFRNMNMSVLKLLVGIFIWIIWRILIRHSLFCGLPRKMKFSVWRLKRKSADFSIDSKKRTYIENQSARVHFFEINEENLRLHWYRRYGLSSNFIEAEGN